MGRKKLGNVLFAKRVDPKVARILGELAELDYEALLSKVHGVSGGYPLEPVAANPSPFGGLVGERSVLKEGEVLKPKERLFSYEELQATNSALVEENVKLGDEVRRLGGALAYAESAGLDELGAMWRDRYLALKEEVKASQGEFSQ